MAGEGVAELGARSRSAAARIDEAYSLRLLVVAVLTLLVLLILGRLFAWIAGGVGRRAQRVLPPRVARVLGVAAAPRCCSYW